MRSIINSALFIIILLSSFICAAAQAADNPAERRARELVQVLSSGNLGQIKEYVKNNYSDEFLKLPMDVHVGFLMNGFDNSRGYEVDGVQEATADSATLRVKNKLTGEYEAFIVVIDNKPPYKIKLIGGRSPKLPEAQARKELSDKDVARELSDFVKRLADADVFSGTVLLAKDGKPVFEGAYGVANKDFGAANKIDTKFNLGSMNKMFTAVSIAQLVEKGKLSYDDPLAKFLPDFPDAESAQKIKVKNLLSHTAGLGGYFSDRWNRTSRARVRNVDDMIAIAKQDEKLLFEPGTKWQYSNTGMLVLGKVIEIVSGKSYYDYIADNVTGPAGMANTGCFELDRVNANLAVGYDKEFTERGIIWKNNVFEHVMRGGPQGGCYSTAEDLLRFDQALRSGKLVRADTFKTLTSAKPELHSPSYGYGFQVDAQKNTAGHGGGFTGINSNLEMFLGSGWTAIVLSNYTRGASPVIQKMESLIGSSGKATAVGQK